MTEHDFRREDILDSTDFVAQDHGPLSHTVVTPNLPPGFEMK